MSFSVLQNKLELTGSAHTNRKHTLIKKRRLFVLCSRLMLATPLPDCNIFVFYTVTRGMVSVSRAWYVVLVCSFHSLHGRFYDSAVWADTKVKQNEHQRTVTVMILMLHTLYFSSAFLIITKLFTKLSFYACNLPGASDLFFTRLLTNTVRAFYFHGFGAIGSRRPNLSRAFWGPWGPVNGSLVGSMLCILIGRQGSSGWTTLGPEGSPKPLDTRSSFHFVWCWRGPLPMVGIKSSW